MSRNKKDSKDTKEVIIYNHIEEDLKSQESLMNNVDSKFEENIKHENGENKNKKEKNIILELEQIYNKLPEKKYDYIFDEDYMNYFVIDNNLKNFEIAINIIKKAPNKNVEIINKYYGKIKEKIFDEFDYNTIKIYIIFNRIFQKFKNFFFGEENKEYLDKIFESMKDSNGNKKENFEDYVYYLFIKKK